MQGLPRAYAPKPIVPAPDRHRLHHRGDLRAVSFAVYYGMGWIRPAFGASASYIVFAFLVAVYVGLLYVGSKEEPLKMEDPNAPVTALPLPGPTIRSGLHFLLPVVVLVWALMVDRLSPGLSAFWAACVHGVHPAHAAPADGDAARQRRSGQRDPRGLHRPDRRPDRRRAQHDRHRHRHGDRRYHRRRGQPDRCRLGAWRMWSRFCRAATSWPSWC